MNVQNLSIFVITYNRSFLLRRTLDYLVESVLREYPIVIINNASTDDTLDTVSIYQKRFTNLKIITNKYNVGPNANFLKAFDNSDSEYTWILCDDDIFDLSNISDVLKVMQEGKVDLIHVGAHEQKKWLMGGVCMAPAELLDNGYAYFKFSSFMPCNIFRTNKFGSEFLIKAYNNIVNAYPHMPFLFGMYLQNKKVYISSKQIVFAQGGQSYDQAQWFVWWMKTCELLEIKKDVRKAYIDQWKDNGVIDDKIALNASNLALRLVSNSKKDLYYVRNFQKKYLTFYDRLRMNYYYLVDWIYTFGLVNHIYDKIIKMRNKK